MAKGDRKPFGPLYQEAVIQNGRERGLNFGTVSVLRALVSFCNGDSGQARPGLAKLRERAGCSEKTIERALRTLRNGGFIIPIAYANGGRGRATVYAFSLPAWSGQPRQITTDKESEESEQENHRQSVQKPPTLCPETTDKKSVPTERTERTEYAAAPSRREPSLVPDPNRGGELVTFSKLVTRYGYGRAREIEKAAREAA